MRYVIAVVLVLIMAILAPSTAHAQLIAVEPPTDDACWGSWNVTILPSQYLLVHVLGNNYSLYIFTPSQYDNWVSGGQAYAVYASNVTGGWAYVIPIPPGQYSIVLYPTPCGLGANAIVRIVNQPGVGITSLGPTITNELLAYVNLTVYQPGNPLGIALGSLVVVSSDNYETMEYWVEGVLNIESGNSLLTIRVINVTSRKPQVVSEASRILGPVETPYALYLVVMVNVTNGNARAWVGYVVIENGSNYSEPMINWAYNASLGPATKAVIMMNPYLATPSNYSYDSELIVGNGIGSTQPLSVQVALLYWNGGSFMPVVNTYNFAINTNLTSTYLSVTTCNGLPCVVTGEPTYGRIGAPEASSVPMTYVEWVGPSGNIHGTYITSPINVTYPRTLKPAPGVMMVLSGMWVMSNGAWEFVNSTGIEVMPTGMPSVVIIKPSYIKYYLVSITSPVQVSINGSLIKDYVGWVREGSTINITAKPNYLGNGTRLLPINGSLLITVDKPMNITIEWTKQYLVTVSSEYPVSVNGTITTSYTTWVNVCNYVNVNASTYYVGYGVRYVAINGTGSYRACMPMDITVDWEAQCLVNVVSPVPVLVNGVETSNYTAWITNGTSLTISVPMYYYLGNATRLVLKPPVNGTVMITKPMNITITGSPQYLVIIRSPLPVIVNGTRTTNYTAWVWRGTVVRLSIPRCQVLPNLTLLVASTMEVNGHEYPIPGNAILIIDSPTNVSINYSRYYTMYLVMTLIALIALLLLIARFRGGKHGGDTVIVK